MYRVVIDTCVVVAGLRSRRGASFKLLQKMGRDPFTPCVSVPLVLEYEAAGKRYAREMGLTHADIDRVVDYICRVAEFREIHFLWRPCLKDPADDMVLELAVEAAADMIITHNVADFDGAQKFDVAIVRPGAFLRMLGEPL